MTMLRMFKFIIYKFSIYLKKNISNKKYKTLQKIYHLFKDLRFFYYNKNKDLQLNEKNLDKLNINKKTIYSNLSQFSLDYYDENLSWHYHLFAGLKDFFLIKKSLRILEIGTYDGKFANFLSKVYPDSEVYTLDLPTNDTSFTSTYSRNYKEVFLNFIDQRDQYLSRNNIKFIEMDSINIQDYFYGKKFDLIWVDGDHLNPQVTFDILNCINLLNNKSVICVDDIIISNKYLKRVKNCTNESFKALDILEKKKIIKNYYFLKRIKKSNSTRKKFISLSIKN